MSIKTIRGSNELAQKIKSRRNELGLTIEDAASRAGVGTKTWSRYEAGESIRTDKCKGICKALNWREFPNSDNKSKSLLEECRKHKAWSQFLADDYGDWAAISFAIGSDILLDYINQDLSDLGSMPFGTHIGQLNTSFIKDELPAQFLLQYDYDFLYQMKCTLEKLRDCAGFGIEIIAHSVMDELVIYLSNEEAKTYVALSDESFEPNKKEKYDYEKDWMFDLFDDMDIVTFLYSDYYLDKDHPYHFAHWADQQFYMN